METSVFSASVRNSEVCSVLVPRGPNVIVSHSLTEATCSQHLLIPCSALKGETVPDSLPATPKSPPTRRVPPRVNPRPKEQSSECPVGHLVPQSNL